MGARVLVVDDSSTIRKVVSAMLSRSDHEAVSAPDGEAALERLRREAFDLVLVDCVMPRMDGSAFCRELRADPELAATPVVLMSALDDALADDARDAAGAIDTLRKPFDARALRAVVESALRRANEPRAPEEDAPPASSIAAASTPFDRPTDPGLVRRAVARDFARALSLLVAGSIERATEGRARADEIEAGIVRALGPEAVDVLAAKLLELELGSSAESLSGDLTAVPLPEVLQLLHMQRQSGVLTVTDGHAEVAITLREGLVDLALGRGTPDEYRLGRYLVEEGLVTEDELAMLLRNRAGSRRLLGDTLVHFGLVAEDDVRRALVRQSSELVYEVLRWSGGRFTFVRDASPPEATAAHLGLQVSPIVLEGFRRVDEWRVIEGAIDLDAILQRDELRAADDVVDSLSRRERLVLDAIDGVRTVREVLAAAAVGSFDGCKIIHRFLQTRIVRRRAA